MADFLVSKQYRELDSDKGRDGLRLFATGHVVAREQGTIMEETGSIFSEVVARLKLAREADPSVTGREFTAEEPEFVLGILGAVNDRREAEAIRELSAVELERSYGGSI